MAYNQPTDGRVVKGLAQETIAHDGERLEALASLLPPIQDAITEFLREELEAGARQALGVPSDVLKRLNGELQDLGIEIDAKAVQDLASQPVNVSDEVVEEESAHARSTLIRHWTDVLHLAWGLSGAPTGGLRLDEQLLPSARTEEWERYYKTALADLCESVALDADTLQDVTRRFADRVRRHCRAKDLELTRGLSIRSVRGTLVLVEGSRSTTRHQVQRSRGRLDPAAAGSRKKARGSDRGTQGSSEGLT